jgi:AraC-like DNA-binding protein
VAEAFTIMSDGDDLNFDNYLSRYFRYPEFFETVSPVGTSAFDRKLDSLVSMIRNGDTDGINKEWFLDLAEKIVYHSYGNYLALNGIRSVKLETRKELLRRLHTGRQYMDENFLKIDEISEVATISNLSTFHFFRSFRQAFGTTPYQYILNKRLDMAKSMMNDPGTSLSRIASTCNFSDLFTFSKAFKRRFSVSPSQFQTKII